jgi:muramoyltetrapeptide carboxypeptidase
MGGNTSDTERMLVYLDMLGVFQKIKGLVFGRTFKYTTSSPDRTLFDILKELGSRYAMPVIANVDIGHTKPLLTVPIGVEVEIDTSKELICITEAATS